MIQQVSVDVTSDSNPVQEIERDKPALVFEVRYAADLAVSAAGLIKLARFAVHKDRVGALYEMLQPFRAANLNLTKIESRPTKKKAWEYLFYVDLAAARDDVACSRALTHLSEFASMLRVLGSYASSRTKVNDAPVVQEFK